VRHVSDRVDELLENANGWWEEEGDFGGSEGVLEVVLRKVK